MRRFVLRFSSELFCSSNSIVPVIKRFFHHCNNTTTQQHTMMDSSPKSSTTIQQAIESYKKGSPPDNGSGEWVTDANYDETRRFLGKSYAGATAASGEPVCDWVSNHITGNWYTDQQHRKNLTFVLGLACYEAFKRNPLVVSKRESDNGELSTAAIIYEYNPAKDESSSVSSKIMGHWHLAWAMCKLLARTPIPELWNSQGHKQDAIHFEKKWKNMITTTEDWHKKHGPQEVHWHVFAMGVDPEHEGQGHGRELMEKIHDLADEVGVACYLECGISNKTFYEKMGYTVSTRLTIEDPVDPSRDPLNMFVLVRKPLPPSPLEAQFCVVDQVLVAKIDEQLGQPIASMVVEAQCVPRPGPVWVNNN